MATEKETVMVVNRIEKSNKQMSLKDLRKHWKAGLVEFPAIQRNYVWGEIQCNDEGTETQSNWILTLATNFPAPSILVNKVKREVNGKQKTIFRILDGQQRTTTAIDFIDETDECKNGGFSLHADTDSVVLQNMAGEIEEHRLAEYFFAELPEDVKEMILDFKFDMILMEDLTEEQEELVFVRFNSGMALTKIENLRAEVGTKTTEFINELSSSNFWGVTAGLSKDQQNRFVDFELILQTAMVVSETERTKNGFSSVHIGFSDKAKSKPTGIDTWAEGFKATGLPVELMEKLKLATAYLEKAFPEKESKYHKKSHIPMMVMLALQAIADGMDSNKFAAIVNEFHLYAKEGKQSYVGYGDYKKVSSSKTADKTSVETRLHSMFRFYDDVKDSFNVKYFTPTERKEQKVAATRAKREQDKIARQEEKERQKKQDAMNKDGAKDAEKQMKEQNGETKPQDEVTPQDDETLTEEEREAKRLALLAAGGGDQGGGTTNGEGERQPA